jgi:hypothetical protein
MNWNKKFGRVGLIACLMAAFVVASVMTGCKSSKLEPGGAYAPVVTNSVGGLPTVSTNSDPVLYAADAAFDLAYGTVQTAFKLERDNRALLWKLDPDIKHTLDKIRPEVESVIKEYAAGRMAYIAAPTPQTSDLLTTITSKLAQLAVGASAAVVVKK